MKPYRLHEADIEVPETWQDNTINAFSIAVGKHGGAANFVVTRDAVTQCPDVQAYADQQLVEAAKKLKGYKLLERKQVRIDGRQAMEANYTWLTPEKTEIQQRQAYVKWRHLFLVFTLTAKTDDFANHEHNWKAIIESVRLGAD